LKEIAKGTTQFEFLSQMHGFQPIAIAGALHYCAVEGFLLPRKHRYSEYSFISDNRYFCRFTARRVGEQGYDAGSGEVDQIRFTPVFINDPSLGKAYRFKAGSHPFISIFRECGKKQILFGSMKG
jgi:hypothetical protein